MHGAGMGSDFAFGDLVRAHRVAAGMTQEELAEHAGLSARAVSDLERGLRATPHFATVHRLAEALGLGPDERSAFQAAARPGIADVPAPPGALPVPATPLIG